MHKLLHIGCKYILYSINGILTNSLERRFPSMVIVLLNWSYILFITFLTGFCFYKCLNKFVNCNTYYSLSHNIVCGIVVTTIYAQFFSIFHKVGLLANLFSFLFFVLQCLSAIKSELSIRIKKNFINPMFMGRCFISWRFIADCILYLTRNYPYRHQSLSCPNDSLV